MFNSKSPLINIKIVFKLTLNTINKNSKVIKFIFERFLNSNQVIEIIFLFY